MASQSQSTQPRRPNNQVRGPTSALSSFLREQGIRIPTNPYRRIEQPQQVVDEGTENQPDVQINGQINIQVNVQSNDQSGSVGGVELPAQKTQKRKRVSKKKVIKSSDDDDDGSNGKFKKSLAKIKNSDPLVTFCSSCNRRFVPDVTGSSGQCFACQNVKGKKSQKGVVKARKLAANVVLEATGGHNGVILPLRDLCLRFISDNIEDVEGLGVLERETMIKFSKIISKRRQLNNQTVSLFLGPDEDEIIMFDCTNLDEIGLSLIPTQCHNLRVLNLGLCGRLTDTVLNLICERCTNLEELTLHGAFLCSSNGWSMLFENLSKLQVVRLKFAARLSDDSIKSMATYCSDLRILEIDDCTLIGDSGVLQIRHFSKLTHLTLNSVGVLNNDTMLIILSEIGRNLTHLSLNRHPSLSDSVLRSIQTNCQSLNHFSIKLCPLLAEDSISIIELLSNLKPLTSLDISENNNIQDDLINCIANIHGENVKDLNLNGLDELSESTLFLLCSKLPVVERLDLSWIRYITFNRSMDDLLLTELMNCSRKLIELRVFGCNRLSSTLLDKEWTNDLGHRIIIQGNEFD